jgi:gluconolactonase
MRYTSPSDSICAASSWALMAARGGLLAAAYACAMIPLAAQTPSIDAVSVVRLDPALDALIAPGTTPELVKGDYFGFVEGPVWVRQGGYLLFSDVGANRIYKLTPQGQLSTFLDRSGFTGTDSSTAGMEVHNGRLHVIVLGSNGITIDAEGRVVFCAHGDRAVKRREKDGTVTVLADRIDGKRFSGPNDLAYRADGTLYFTDFIGGLRGGAESPLREIPYGGLYMLRSGTPTLLDKDPLGGTPNGLAFSPDELTLYLGAGPRILQYDVQADGSLTSRRVLIDMSLEKVAGGADGMKVDLRGNVYTTGPGGVWVVSPDGKHLGTIRIPGVANLAFGGADGQTIYFMARRDIYRLGVKIGGRAPGVR